MPDQEEILPLGKESLISFQKFRRSIDWIERVSILTIYNTRATLNRAPRQKPALYLYCILFTEPGKTKGLMNLSRIPYKYWTITLKNNSIATKENYWTLFTFNFVSNVFLNASSKIIPQVSIYNACKSPNVE